MFQHDAATVAFCRFEYLADHVSILIDDRGERNDLERELDGQKPDRFTSTARRESVDVVPEHDLPGFNSQTNLKRLPVATFAFSEQLGAASLFGVGPPLA